RVLSPRGAGGAGRNARHTATPTGSSGRCRRTATGRTRGDAPVADLRSPAGASCGACAAGASRLERRLPGARAVIERSVLELVADRQFGDPHEPGDGRSPGLLAACGARHALS